MSTLPKIIKNLTTKNYTSANKRTISYIVIHWVGSVSSAYNNTVYFKSSYRGSSAHYFVDDDSIYQCVEDGNIAWHCGTSGTYYHKYARNSNSIGIEMCLDKANSISEKTIEKTGILVRYLMDLYNIPAENVIRHYDVTHKKCPGIYVDNAKWNTLHKKLTKKITVNTGSSNNKSEVEIGTNITVDFSYPLIYVKTYGKVVTAKNDPLNIRVNPKASSAVVAGYEKGLANGTPLYITGSYGKWFLVTLLNGTKGWVSRQYVEIGINKKINTIASPLVLRAGRGSKYSKLASMKKNEKCVQLDAYSDGWSRVIYNSKVGYASSKYLKNV